MEDAPSGGSAPEGCRERELLEDAVLAAQAMRKEMSEYDEKVIAELVQSREVAQATIKRLETVHEVEQNTLDEELEEEVIREAAEVSDDEDEPCMGLLDDQEDPSPSACLSRCADQYGLDVLAVAGQKRLDFYEKIRLVNWIRQQYKSGVAADEIIEKVQQIESKSEILKDDNLLRPIIESDPLLTALESFDDWDDAEDARLAEAVYNAVID